MADQLDALGGGTVEHVDGAAVLHLLVQVDGDQAVQRVAEVVGHAELAQGQAGGDVLAGLAGDGQLQVVDGGRPVQHYRLDQAALDPVDQVGAAAGLDDVPAQGGDDRPALAVAAQQVVAHPAEV